MEQSVARRLLFAKQQLSSGFAALAQPTDFAAGEAMLRFHDAFETFVLALADHVGLPRQRIDFHQYPPKITQHTNKPFAHKAVADELNDLRVPTKHLGRLPRFQDVLDLSRRILPLFEDNAQAYLGQSFQSVRLSESINHPETRQRVAAAETAIEQGRYFDALAELKPALQIYLRHFKRTGLPLDAQPSMEWPAELLSLSDAQAWLFNDPNQMAVLRHTNEQWKDSMSRLALLALGINLAEYATFEYLTPTVHINEHGNTIGVYKKHGSVLRDTRESAEFCLNFVLGVVSRLQAIAAVPDIGSSFQLRATRDCHLYSVGKGVVIEGTLSKGDTIQRAKLGKGPNEELAECWMWTDGGKQLLAAIDSCEVTGEARPYSEESDSATSNRSSDASK